MIIQKDKCLLPYVYVIKVNLVLLWLFGYKNAASFILFDVFYNMFEMPWSMIGFILNLVKEMPDSCTGTNCVDIGSHHLLTNMTEAELDRSELLHRELLMLTQTSFLLMFTVTLYYIMKLLVDPRPQNEMGE